MIRERIYFPVQSGLGFKIAGGGKTPSKFIHIRRFMT
jgi:hypothetical protein